MSKTENNDSIIVDEEFGDFPDDFNFADMGDDDNIGEKDTPELQEGEKDSSGSSEPVETPVEPVETPVEPVETPAEPVKAKRTRSKPQSKPQKTDKEKATSFIMRRARKESLQSLEHLMRGKQGRLVKIKDIALFIDDPEDPLLAELSKNSPLRNRVNLSANVEKNRVLKIGVEILEADRLHMPIQVALVDGVLECTSGRHRLAFLLLCYGPNAKIPAYIEEMSLNEARDVVVVANQSRSVKALERAQHTVLKAVGGNVSAEQDEMYEKTVKTKSKAKKYCIYSVIERAYPVGLSFPVSLSASKSDGGLTTLTNLENYIGSATEWTKGMPREKFDDSLKKAIEFINALVECMKSIEGFESRHHLASMTMSAIGKYYKAYCDVHGGNPIDIASDVAESVVSMGEIGRQKSETTYEELSQIMRS